MQARRLYRSLSLRIALAYALVFVVSVGLLLGLFYWASVVRPLDTIRAQVEEEMSAAAGVYMLEGLDAARAALERRADALSESKAFHALIDTGGRTVTSNLPSWPARTRRCAGTTPAAACCPPPTSCPWPRRTG